MNKNIMVYKPNMYHFSMRLVEFFSSLDTDLKSPFIKQIKNRFFCLLRSLENHEHIFFTHKQILLIREGLKNSGVDMTNAPSFLKNIRLALSRANMKLASLLKFSGTNVLNSLMTTDTSSSNYHNIYSKNFLVDYSPTKTNSNGNGKMMLFGNYN